MTRSNAFLIAIVHLLTWGSGCAHLPGTMLTPEDTRVRLEAFRTRLPVRYEVVSTVVFKFKTLMLSSLSMASVDLAAERLSVAGVTPLGLTLFRVSTQQGRITESFTSPELAKYGDAARAVADTIREIYFDLVPDGPAPAVVRDRGFEVWTGPSAGRRLRYTFDGPDGTLKEKRLVRDGAVIWTIRYDDWTTDRAGTIYPRHIRFEQREHGYELLIRVTEERPL